MVCRTLFPSQHVPTTEPYSSLPHAPQQKLVPLYNMYYQTRISFQSMYYLALFPLQRVLPNQDFLSKYVLLNLVPLYNMYYQTRISFQSMYYLALFPFTTCTTEPFPPLQHVLLNFVPLHNMYYRT